MERGIPDITVYTFEVRDGREMHYPDAELWTLDYAEADAFAADKGYLLMGMDWGDDAPELIEDYTPAPQCAICGGKLERNMVDEGYVHADDADDTHDPALSAVLVTREKP